MDCPLGYWRGPRVVDCSIKKRLRQNSGLLNKYLQQSGRRHIFPPRSVHSDEELLLHLRVLADPVLRQRLHALHSEYEAVSCERQVGTQAGYTRLHGNQLQSLSDIVTTSG